MFFWHLILSAVTQTKFSIWRVIMAHKTPNYPVRSNSCSNMKIPSFRRKKCCFTGLFECIVLRIALSFLSCITILAKVKSVHKQFPSLLCTLKGFIFLLPSCCTNPTTNTFRLHLFPIFLPLSKFIFTLKDVAIFCVTVL